MSGATASFVIKNRATSANSIEMLSPTAGVLTMNDMVASAPRIAWDANGVVAIAQSLLVTNGIASFSPVASVAIAATGWTNFWSTNNAVIVFGGTAVNSFKKRAGALTSTNITYPVFTGNSTVILQPGQALVISGTSVTGSADPF
jgi:hypothetical protein